MIKEVQQHSCMCACMCVFRCVQVCACMSMNAVHIWRVTSVSVLAFHLLCLIWTSFFVAGPLPPSLVFPWNQYYRSSKYESGLYMASGIQTQVLRFEDNCFHPLSHQYCPQQHLKRTYLNIWKYYGILFYHFFSFIMRF